MTAAKDVGTPQIRNMGMVRGNLVQRPRAKAMSGSAHTIQIAKTAVKRAILKAAGRAVV